MAPALVVDMCRYCEGEDLKTAHETMASGDINLIAGSIMVINDTVLRLVKKIEEITGETFEFKDWGDE